MLSKIKAANVDAIYAPNYTQELILISQQARAIGFNGPLIFGLDACTVRFSLRSRGRRGHLYQQYHRE